MIKSNYQREKTGKLTDVSTAFKLSERENRRKLVHWYWFALTEGNGDKMEFQPQLLKPTFFFLFHSALNEKLNNFIWVE